MWRGDVGVACVTSGPARPRSLLPVVLCGSDVESRSPLAMSTHLWFSGARLVFRGLAGGTASTARSLFWEMSLCFLFFSCPRLRRTSPPRGSRSTAGNVLTTRPRHRPRRPVSRACCGHWARWKEGRPWGLRPEQARDPVSHVLVSPGWCENVGVHRARLRWGSLQKPNANGCWPRCRVETEFPGL